MITGAWALLNELEDRPSLIIFVATMTSGIVLEAVATFVPRSTPLPRSQNSAIGANAAMSAITIISLVASVLGSRSSSSSVYAELSQLGCATSAKPAIVTQSCVAIDATTIARCLRGIVRHVTPFAPSLAEKIARTP
jgi:hypothetical protein